MLFHLPLDLVKNALSSFSVADEGDFMEAAAKAEDEQETLILHIYAGYSKILDEAEERIDDFIKDEFSTTVSVSPIDWLYWIITALVVKRLN